MIFHVYNNDIKIYYIYYVKNREKPMSYHTNREIIVRKVTW